MPDDTDKEALWAGADAPSKSERKRQMTALQELGTRLVDLSDTQLKKIPIEDSRLEEAIAEARRIKAWGGLRRQLQYIGKIMRQIDPAPIQQALDELDGQDQRANARFHQIERLRDDLVTQGDRAIDTVLLEFPLADRQHLRQLIRQYAHDLKAKKASTVPKKLFRYLRELDDASSFDST